MPRGCYVHEEQTTIVTVDEAYEQLKAAVLAQAISDYYLSVKNLPKTKKHKTRQMRQNLIFDAERFFTNPPYDFGDVDTKKVKLMLDTAIKEGFDLIISNRWRYE